MSRGRIIGGSAAAASLASAMGLYFEGVYPVGYADPVGIPTDCAGETGLDVRVGKQRFTYDECVRRYPVRLQRVWDEGLSRCIHRDDLTVHEGGALMSWGDNVGVKAACSSTLVRRINAGAAPAVWCAQLLRWDKATVLGITVTLPGLKKRRLAEKEMCLGGNWRSAIVTVHWLGLEESA